MSQTRNRWTDYKNGLRGAVPVILGFVPCAIAYAVMARQAGLTLVQTCAMSIFVFAGASQIMTVGMYVQGASLIAMVVATFMLNFRHLIMSICVHDLINAHDKSKPSVLAKLFASYGITDEGFAIFTTGDHEKCSVSYLLGLLTVTYFSWVSGTVIGAIASDFLPEILSASLGIALYAMFIGLLVPNLPNNWKLGALVALTAVCNSLLTQVMAASWAMISSTLICAFIGTFFVELEPDREPEGRDKRDKQEADHE